MLHCTYGLSVTSKAPCLRMKCKLCMAPQACYGILLQAEQNTDVLVCDTDVLLAMPPLTVACCHLQLPLLLLWGELDPWIGPNAANRIQQLYPKATYVGLQSGHCPQDDSPELVNQALDSWVNQL